MTTSVAAGQVELDLFRAQPGSGSVEELARLLAGRDWLTAAEILRDLGLEATEGRRRAIRAAAEGSEGRIAGGQRGYRLTRELTKAEFDACYGFLLSQARRMQQRAVEMAKVFYARQAEPAAVGSV